MFACNTVGVFCDHVVLPGNCMGHLNQNWFYAVKY